MPERDTVRLPKVDSMLYHIAKLANELPHRGTATDGERRAHEYCAEQFRSAGLEAVTEAFPTVASAYRPFLLAAALMLAGAALFFAFPAPAVVLTLLTAISAFLELSFRGNPLRWLLPKKQSWNTHARLQNPGVPRRTLVILAHVDSHRTPWIWASPKTFRAYQFVSSLAMIAFALLPLCLLGAWGFDTAPPAAVLAPCIVLIFFIFLLTLQAETSPFTRGANDNASGVALLLELAKQFAERPPANTDFWFVCTGAEEVGAHGAAAFVKRHASELQNAVFLIIDNIAGKESRPHFYEQETMLFPVRFAEELLHMAREVAAAHPHLGAQPFSQRGAFTDGTPVALAGFACLPIVNHTETGWIPNWHHRHDTLENVDRSAMAISAEFVVRLISRIDAAADAMPRHKAAD